MGVKFPKFRWETFLHMKRRRISKWDWVYFFINKKTRAQVSPEFISDHEACNWFYENYERLLSNYKLDEAFEKEVLGHK